MKLSRSSVLSSLVLATAVAFPSLAQANFYGDTVNITGSGFALYPDTYSNSATVGSGVEFTHTAEDFFGQNWVLSVDVNSYQFKLTWNETTLGNDSDLNAGSDEIYGVDISFDSSKIYALAVTDYTSTNNVTVGPSLLSITPTSANSVHLSFSSLNGGETYVISVVPEPQTYAMLLAGLGLAGLAARRQRKQG